MNRFWPTASGVTAVTPLNISHNDYKQRVSRSLFYLSNKELSDNYYLRSQITVLSTATNCPNKIVKCEIHLYLFNYGLRVAFIVYVGYVYDK